jgi:GDP-L-fucose synthase
MRVVVTGAGPNGFLGKHVKKAFDDVIGGGRPVTQLDGSGMRVTEHVHVDYLGREYDFTKFDEAYEALYDHGHEGADVLVHMAAVCGGILANKKSPADFLTKNTLMSINAYEAALKHAKRRNKKIRIYTLGSVCAYPKHCRIPFVEDDLFYGYPEETNAPYGQAKRTLLMLGQTYRQQYPELIAGAHLIPVNMYGEHDHFDLVNSHVIPAFVNKFTTAVTQGLGVVECWGTGEATREFLYAGDCAKAIVAATLGKLDTPLPINIGTGKDISIKDLACLVAELTGFKGVINFTGEVSDGQPQRRLDVNRARKMLNFEAKTELKDGLKKTIEWYKRNK